MSGSAREASERSLYPAAKLELRFVWATVFLAFIASLFERSQLVDHIPIETTLLGAVTGFGIGAWLSWRTFNHQERKLRLREKFALFALPAIFILFGTYGARVTYEIVQFAGANTEHAEVRAKVVDKFTPRLPFATGRAQVLFSENSREIDVLVNDTVYQNLEPFRFPGRDCLILTVETNGTGVRRVHVPNHIDEAFGPEATRYC